MPKPLRQFEAYFRWRNATNMLMDQFVMGEAKSKAEFKRQAQSLANQRGWWLMGVDELKSTDDIRAGVSWWSEVVKEAVEG